MQLVTLVILQASLALCASAKPNIVLILTDDQDILMDSMVSMTQTIDLIATHGVTFRHSFVNTPVCCPSRSTILTGKYLHNTGVRNNSLSGNCSSPAWQTHHEPTTFASALQRANYSTFYAGKYLNQYGSFHTGGTRHVPAGYDWWLGLKGNSKYYNYTLSVNGTAKHFGDEPDEYLTDVMKTYALSFLNQKRLENSPFFMMLSTPAAHEPFTPALRHQNAFPGAKAVRTPSFNYSSSDKHWLVRMPPNTLPSDVTFLDDIHRHRLQTLLAVDELVQALVEKLQSMHVLDDTYIMLTSDHGYHIGQFVQPWDKRQPYETDIRVPLLIRGPGVKRNHTLELPVSAIDLAPTILEMAGLSIPDDIDGQSFLKHIKEGTESDAAERFFLIEYFGEGDQSKIDGACPWTYDGNLTECTKDSWCKCQDSRNNTYACVRRLSRTVNFKFCQFSDDENFVEVYDLERDPFELVNIFPGMDVGEQNDYTRILGELQSCQGTKCHL